MNRRQLLLGAAAGSLSAVATPALAGKMVKPWEWVEKQGEVADTDGTPLQFMPKGRKDPNPLEKELEKYKICPYCGMNRTKFSHSRHLIHFADDLVDGTCSIHCAAISLSLNLDRIPKAIYVGDNGFDAEVKPLVEVDKAHYVLDPTRMGTMSGTSKLAYADAANARAAAGTAGTVVTFDAALTAAYADMARDTIMIRKRRAEKRHKSKN